MKLWVPEPEPFVGAPGNRFLSMGEVTREAVRLFRNSNLFVQSVSEQYDEEFAKSGRIIGETLRIRLPSQYLVN